MDIFDFIQENPVGGSGFVYKSTTQAFYYDGLTTIPIGQDSYFVATTGSGTTTMTVDSVTSGTLAVNQTLVKVDTVTITQAAPAVVTWTNHGIPVGTTVRFYVDAGDELPEPLVQDKDYFVVSVPSTDTFTFSERVQGAPVTTTTAGVGTITGTTPIAVITDFQTFDGTSGTITLSQAVTWSNPTTFGGRSAYPRETVRGIPYLDGTYYVMTPQGTIQGSEINDPTRWSALNAIQCQAEPDGGVCLARQLNLIVGFNSYSTEFFYNAGNPTGSPLLPYSSAFIEVGCASADSVSQTDNSLFFIGVTKQKGRSVYQMIGTNVNIVSTPFIDKVLNRDSLEDVSAVCIRISGHIFYILTLSDSQKTLVFDVTTKYWHLWTISEATESKSIESLSWNTKLVSVGLDSHGFTDGDLVVISGCSPEEYNGTFTINVDSPDTFTHELVRNPGSIEVLGEVFSYTQRPFSLASYTTGDNLDIVQDSTNGFIYFLDNSLYADLGQPIDFLSRTFKFDAGSNKKKFTSQLEVIADKINSTAYVRYTNDDYQTYSYFRPVSLNQQRSLLNRLGQTRRRAYEVRHHDNCPLRLEALEITPTEGSS